MRITGTEDLEYPEEEASAVALDKAISLLSSPVATVLRTMAETFQGGIEERRHEFLHEVAARLNENAASLSDLEARLADFEAHARLLSATQQVYDAFIRTHVDEKKRVLANAAVNAMLNPPVDELEENEFLEFLAQPTFNVYHVRLLRLFSKEDVEVARSVVGGSLLSRIEKRGGEYGLQANNSTLRKVWKDLSDRGFLIGGDLATFMSGSGVGAKRTTELGDRFLAFIEDPGPSNGS